MSSSPSPIIVSANATPNWTNHTTIFNRIAVNLNDASVNAWPGGGFYGTTTAIAGAIKVPAEVGRNFDGANPTVIINSGIMGLAESYAVNGVGVGVYGGARAAVTQAQVWGANFTVSNKLESIGGTPYHCQMNGVEVDTTWHQPAQAIGGTNMVGVNIPAECYGGQPDGVCAAVLSKRVEYASHGWKDFAFSDHGAASRFAYIGMAKGIRDEGASGSQGLYWISSSGGVAPLNGTDTNQYHHTYLNISPGGDMVLQANYYGTPGSFIVGNSNLGQVSRISPTDGFVGPKATLNALQINGASSFAGTVNVTGSVTAGSVSAPSITSSGQVNAAEVVSNGQLYAVGNVNAQDMTIRGNGSVAGNLSVNSALFVSNFFFFQGKNVVLTADGGTIPAGYKALIVQS